MTLPFILQNLAAGRQPLSDIDADFAALTRGLIIPCTASGTNTIVLTPRSGWQGPDLTSYLDYVMFAFSPVATNSGAVTIAYQSLGARNAYQDTPSGPAVLTGGEMVTHNMVLAVYDGALNSSAGGLHIFSETIQTGITIGGSGGQQFVKWTGFASGASATKMLITGTIASSAQDALTTTTLVAAFQSSGYEMALSFNQQNNHGPILSIYDQSAGSFRTQNNSTGAISVAGAFMAFGNPA